MGMASHVNAQKRGASYNPKAWYIGAEGGVNIFFGDIKYNDYLPNFKHNELTYGGGLLLGKHLSPLFSIKGNIHFSELSGTKSTPALLRTFKTKEQDASLSLQMNLFQLFSNRPRLERLSIWGELGIGVMRWQSLLYNTETGDTLANLFWNTKEYETAIMIPMGLNIKYYLNKNISLDLYSGLRFANSDLLDAKEGGIKFDYYWYSGMAINYHIGFYNKRKPTVVSSKHKSGELELLDYLGIDPFQDPELKRITKNEYLKKEEEKLEKSQEKGSPYRVEFWVPQNANNKRFQILVSIKKRGITGNGFFRLMLPSGFYPEPIKIKEVTYTRIAYNYDFDFYLPMNKDTLLIPIDITISEREDGTYPLFIEGEVMNQNGELFPIRNAQYVKIGENIAYNDLPTVAKKEDKKPVYSHPENVTEKVVEASGNKTYRIQILACRKPSKKVDDFLKKHKIDQKVYLYEAGDWWRYSIYHLSTLKEAQEYLKIVRSKHHVSKAFIVEFNNGKRSIPQHQSKDKDASGSSRFVNESSNNNKQRDWSVQPKNTKAINKNGKKDKTITEQPLEAFQPVLNNENISVYRIEIAVSPSYPLPLRQLQNWVANEKITEWTYKDDYRYTIGRFENEQVARAFLKYVRMQFALPDAHLVETKGKTWQRVVR